MDTETQERIDKLTATTDMLENMLREKDALNASLMKSLGEAHQKISMMTEPIHSVPLMKVSVESGAEKVPVRDVIAFLSVVFLIVGTALFLAGIYLRFGVARFCMVGGVIFIIAGLLFIFFYYGGREEGDKRD